MQICYTKLSFKYVQANVCVVCFPNISINKSHKNELNCVMLLPKFNQFNLVAPSSLCSTNTWQINYKYGTRVKPVCIFAKDTGSPKVPEEEDYIRRRHAA